MNDYRDPLSQATERFLTPDTTLEQFYHKLQQSWRQANPQRSDRITVIQTFEVTSPISMKITFEVRADSPEEALGKILLAARREEIRIRA